MKKLLAVAIISAFSLGTLAFAEEAPAKTTTTKTEVKKEEKTTNEAAAPQGQPVAKKLKTKKKHANK